jgi:hypothetical protein
MTKPNSTLIVVVLDRSSSMLSVVDATIEGYNAFVAKQREQPGEAVMDFVQFDNEYTPVFQNVPLADVPLLTRETYVPRGTTALLDAVGIKMTEVGNRLAALPEYERPSKVIFVIQTDGAENASRKYNIDSIREMIKTQRDVYSWEFIFLGANIDAVAVGANYGMNAANSLSYNADPLSSQKAFVVAAYTTSASRAGQVIGYSSVLRSAVTNSNKTVEEVEAELEKLAATTPESQKDAQ